MSDENTQSQDAQATDNQSTNDQATNSNPGVEARINQLVAEREEARRQAMELQTASQQKEMQYLQMLERMSQQQRPPLEEQQPIDPALDAAMKRYLAPMQQQFAQMSHQIAQQQAQLQFAQTAAQEDPRVVAQAQKLMAQWKQEGKTGWGAPDALVFARGMLGVAPPSANNNARNNMNAFALGGNTPNSAPPPAVAPTKVVELDRSSTDLNYLNNQASALEKNLGDVEF